MNRWESGGKPDLRRSDGIRRESITGVILLLAGVTATGFRRRPAARAIACQGLMQGSLDTGEVHGFQRFGARASSISSFRPLLDPLDASSIADHGFAEV